MYLLEGLLLGFGSILLVGPVVFVLINATVQNGIKSGVSVALGIILGDIIYTIACYKGLEFIINNETFIIVLSYAGFIILFGLGLVYTVKKHELFDKKDYAIKKNYFSNFLKGFSVNFINPFVLSVWLLVVNYAKTEQGGHSFSFMVAVLCGIFLIDLFKVFVSKKLIGFISSEKFQLFYKISGLIMILFSFRILYFIVYK
jgi:threonine/homoserine/homoserine lactone efflux protein